MVLEYSLKENTNGRKLPSHSICKFNNRISIAFAAIKELLQYLKNIKIIAEEL